MRISLLFLLLLLVVWPASASACPLCKEALVSQDQEDDDPLREARAYNNSILFMLAVPYTLVGAFGFLVYRGLKRPTPVADAPGSPTDSDISQQ
jgi:hypothetical protein